MTVTVQQFIDADYTDMFTDASVRFNQEGIDRLAQRFWRFDITMRGGIFTIRVYLNGVLANVNTSSTVPLVTSSTFLNVRRSPSTLVSSTVSTSWVNVSTGIYTVDLSATVFSAGSHIAEIAAQATYTNPLVSGKTSVITQASASYPQQTILSDWVAESMAFAVNSSGIFLDPDSTNVMVAHQHVDAATWDLAIERPD